jgi:PhnB protein
VRREAVHDRRITRCHGPAGTRATGIRRDPQGHLWWVHQHLEDVGLDEMNRRFGADKYREALQYVGDSLREEMERR